jgi:hypothetical protein
MAKEITNTAASVHARLLNQARAGSRSFNDLLQLYAMERFLHRLSRTRHADRFVLKGALLMRVWDTTMFRTTRDIDLLARVSNEVAVLEGVVREACAASVDPDGLQFDPTSVRGETIVEDADYPGVRVTFGGTLGNARLDMQIDVGFGDTITPAPQELDFPTLLPMAGTRLLAYPPETVVAEKFQVMLFRAEANSRLKDFHDVWWISRHFAFDGDQLAAAIRATCAKRGTEIPAEPTALTKEFGSIADKRTQWRVFRKRFGTTNCPEEFEVVVEELRAFLTPVIAAARSGNPVRLRWDAAGSWTAV